MKIYSNGIVRTEFNGLMEFVDASRENYDVFQHGAGGRLPLFFSDDAPDYTHFLAFDRAKIIGVYCIREKKELLGEVISVDAAYRNQGIAKRLVHSAFSYAVERNMVFVPGGFTENGKQYLSHMMPRTHHQEFQQLRIRWSNLDLTVIDGTRPYKLVQPRFSHSHMPVFI